MNMVKVLKKRRKQNSTDNHLQVRSLSDYEIHDWNSDRIVDALRKECKLKKDAATAIAEEVYNELISLNKKEIDVQTLKNIVNYHLFKHGYNGTKLSGQVSVGMSLYDLDNLIKEKSSENSNISNNNPEAIALTVSENTFKKYALKKVFSHDIANAHLEGLIHLHDLGQVNKIYCSAHSVRSIAMHGLGKYHSFDIRSGPAKHAQTLVGHINTYLCSIATYYAGALGLDFVNVYFAPYVEGMTKKEMKQIAQYLIFSLSQSAFSRGGQVLFTDFNVHISIPDWLKKVKAVGPGGKILNRTYDSYDETAKKFLKVMFDVWREGDSNGAPFAFPKCFDKNTPLYSKVENQYKFMTVGDVLSCVENGERVFLPRFGSCCKPEWVQVKNAVCRGEEEGLRIKLNNGAYQDSTIDHKYYVWDGSSIVIREAQDIIIGDILLYSSPFVKEDNDYQFVDVFEMLDDESYQVYNVLKTSDSSRAKRDGWCKRSLCTKDNLTDESYICSSKQKKNSIPVTLKIDEKWAKLLGYFAAEGSLSGNRVNIAAIKNGRCRSKIEKLLVEMGIDFGVDNSSFYIYNTLLTSLISCLFVDYGKVKLGRPAKSKHVPSVIFSSPESVRKAFLAGVFAGDGTVKDYGFALVLSSRSLTYGCKWLLESIGIFSSVYEENRNGYNAVYYSLSIKGQKSVDKALDVLGEDLNAPLCHSNRDNKDSSWYNSIPVSCFNSNNNVCEWEKSNRNYMSLDDDRVVKNNDLDGLIPVVVKGIESVEIEAVAIEVDHSDHDFITGDGTLTKNCDVHVTYDDFEGENLKLLEQACEISSYNGSPYFIMDRDSITLAACCRLRTKVDEALLATPERIRFCGVQNVTINIPQCAYRANGDIDKFYKEITAAMDLAIKAHLQKKKYIESIGKSEGSPLYEIVTKPYFDGDPYVNLEKSTYIVGMIGVNEAVKYMFGQELHESPEAHELGKDVIAYMYSMLAQYKKKHGLKFTLEESPAESAARRLAKVDIEKYPQSKELVNGNLNDDNIYYTNSIHYRPDANIPFIDRLVGQSDYHNMIESGAIIHMFCGEKLPSAKSILNMVEKALRKTDCAQMTISPEFTICYDCSERFSGVKDECPKCKGTNIDAITRVVGYFSKVRNWNISKKRERIDRNNGVYTV